MPTCLGVVPLTVGWTLLQQLVIKKMPNRHFHMSSWLRQSVFQLRLTLPRCVKLISHHRHLKHVLFCFFHAQDILQTSDINVSLFTCLCPLFLYHFLQVISLAVFVSVCFCLGGNICVGCLLRNGLSVGLVLPAGTPTGAGHSLGLVPVWRGILPAVLSVSQKGSRSQFKFNSKL